MPKFERELLREQFKTAIYSVRKNMSDAERRRKPTLKNAASWMYPHGPERRFARWIEETLRKVHGDFFLQVRERLPAWLAEKEIRDSDEDFLDAYEDEFAELMAELRLRHDILFNEEEEETKSSIFSFGQQVDNFNAAQWNKITSLAIGTAFDVDSGFVQPLLRSWTDLNYTLVKSLSEEQIKKMNLAVAEGVQQGRLYTDIMKDLQKIDKNMTRNRSKLIARDQVGKLNGSLTEGRQLDAGVTQYVWVTSMDERVRDSHRPANGSVNDWNDRTKWKLRGSKVWTKRPGDMIGAIPGSQIQCRCTALPDFEDIVGEVDALIAEEERPEAVRTELNRNIRDWVKDGRGTSEMRRAAKILAPGLTTKEIDTLIKQAGG